MNLERKQRGMEFWHVVLEYWYGNEQSSPEQVKDAEETIRKIIERVENPARAEVSLLYANNKLWMNVIRWTWPLETLGSAIGLATALRELLIGR